MEKINFQSSRGRQDEENKKEETPMLNTQNAFSSQSRAGVQNSRNSSDGSDIDNASENNTISKLA